MAENVARVARKGSRVVVTGRLEQRSWETENGEKRTVVEIVADEVGPSLRFATAEVTRTSAGAAATSAAAATAAAAEAAAAGWRRAAPAGADRWRRPTAKSRSEHRGADRGELTRDGARQEEESQAADRRRPIKKKTSILTTESIDWIDYKDVNLLRRFMSERAKIRARRVTGNDAQQQRGGRASDQHRPRDGAAAVQRAPGDAALEGPPRPRRPR